MTPRQPSTSPPTADRADRGAPPRPSLERLWPARISPARHLPAGIIPECVSEPERWFPARPTDITARQAQAACHHCPLRRECARVALDDIGHAYGIWAGVFLHSRWSGNGTAARRDALRTLRHLAYPVTGSATANRVDGDAKQQRHTGIY